MVRITHSRSHPPPSFTPSFRYTPRIHVAASTRYLRASCVGVLFAFGPYAHAVRRHRRRRVHVLDVRRADQVLSALRCISPYPGSLDRRLAFDPSVLCGNPMQNRFASAALVMLVGVVLSHAAHRRCLVDAVAAGPSATCRGQRSWLRVSTRLIRPSTGIPGGAV